MAEQSFIRNCISLIKHAEDCIKKVFYMSVKGQQRIIASLDKDILKQLDGKLYEKLPFFLYFDWKKGKLDSKMFCRRRIDPECIKQLTCGAYAHEDKKIYLFERHIILSKKASRLYHDFLQGKQLSLSDKKAGEIIKQKIDNYKEAAGHLPMAIKHEYHHYKNDMQSKKIYRDMPKGVFFTPDDIYGINVLDELSAYTQGLLFARDEYLKNPSDKNLEGFCWCQALYKKLQGQAPAERIDFLKDEKKLFKCFERIFYVSSLYEGHTRQFSEISPLQKKVMINSSQYNSEESDRLLKKIQDAFMTFTVYDADTGKEKEIFIDNFDRNRLPIKFNFQKEYEEKLRNGNTRN